MTIGNRTIGGDMPVDVLRDQLMMFVRRLRLEAGDNTENWTQLSLLAAIDRLGDNVSPTALARDMNARSSNIAATLRETERQGYVTRALDPDDRRKVRLFLTREGREALETARTQRRRWISSMVGRLSDDDRRTLFVAGDLLERLAADSVEVAAQP